MIGIRHEKYRNISSELPLSLGVDIERTVYNCSKEQNWHENLEIQLCTKGSGTVLLDGEKYSISPGDIITVNSNVVHYTFTDSFLKYTCLIISTEWCKQMNIDCNSLHFHPYVKSDKISNLIKELSSIVIKDDDLLKTAKINEVLLRIIIELTEKHCDSKFSPLSKSKKFDVIKTTVNYIEKNYDKKITLSEISDEVFLDKYTLCKEFKKYTGKTVFEYIHQYRCIKAIDFLTEGHTVSETAFLCGFDNLSFFTKVFKRHTGKKPSHFKK